MTGENLDLGSGGSPEPEAEPPPALTARIVPTWLRRPFLLVRFPGTLAATMAAAVVLAVTAAAPRLFVASAGSAALARQVQDESAAFGGLTARSDGVLAPDRLAFRVGLLRDATRNARGLGPMIVSAVQKADVEVGTLARPNSNQFVQLATRTGFTSHISVVRGSGPGWWVPDSIARRIGVGPGDPIRITVGTIVPGERFFPSGPGATVRVAGVYRDLVSAGPLSPFWQPLSEFINPPFGATAEFPPPFLLGEPAAFFAFEGDTGGLGHLELELPLGRRGLTLEAARALADRMRRIDAAMDDPSLQLSAAFSDHAAGLPSLLPGVNRSLDSLSGPLEAVAFAGRAVALLVVAAAGVYVLHRRRAEFESLRARGVGPLAFGTRVAIETALPLAVGTAAGWALALVLVRLEGPSRLIPGTDVGRAAVDAAVGGLVALGLLGLVVAVSTRASAERRRGAVRRVAARLPWEAVLLVLAAASLYEIEARPVATGQSGAAKIDLLVPLFPLLFIAGLAGVAVRLLRRALPRLRRAAGGRSAPVFLASGRLSAAPRQSLMLVTAATLAVGIVTYASTFVASVRATAREKAEVAVGSDAAITLPNAYRLPKDLGAPATEVVQLPVASTSAGSASVISIDPSTFASAAFWDPSFSSLPLPEILRRLSPGTGSGPVPVVAVGSLPADFSMEFLGTPVPAHVVATARGFPGMPPSGAMVVAATAPLARAARSGGVSFGDLEAIDQLWVKGDPGVVVRTLDRAGLYPASVATAAHEAENPAFLTQSWLFGFLEGLGVLAAGLALATVLLYAESRQRAREVSYALARRMSLRRGAHRRSVAIELAGLLVPAMALGFGLAALAAFLVHGRLDPLPGLPPGAVFRVPAGVLGAVAGAMVAFTLLASVVVQRRADHARVAEVLRDAG